MVPVTLCPVAFPLHPATWNPALGTLPGDGQDTQPSHITEIDQAHYKPSLVLTLDPVPLKSNKTFNRPILSSYLNDYLFAFLCLLTTLLLRIIGALRK